jgi:gluconolactonase
LPTSPQFVDPKSFAVLGPNAKFRNNSFDGGFNPTNTTPPFFQVFHPDFLTDVLGGNATIHQVASNATFAFAHEAPIYDPETDELFFASNDGGPLGMSGLNENNKVGKISLAKVEAALTSAGASRNGSVNVPVTEVWWLFALIIFSLLSSSFVFPAQLASRLLTSFLTAKFTRHCPNDKRRHRTL